MKNSVLVILAAAVMLVSSCVKSGSTVYDYTLLGTFEGYAFNDELTKKYFKDSVCFLEQILTDEYSCLYSNYKDEIFNGGFCLSIKKDSLNTQKTELSDYSSAGPSAGHADSKVYAVYIKGTERPEYDWKIFLDGFDVGICSMRGFCMNNVSKTIKAIEDNPLKKGDYLKVTVTGYLEGAKGQSATVNLVQYTDDSRLVVTDWIEVDMKSLGTVDALRFDVETNRDDFPESFCLDRFIAAVHVEV